MNGRAQKKFFFLMLAAVLMLACVPTLAPASTPIPTFDANSIPTSIAQTAEAAATETQFYITPSATPTLTFTPTRTPTITPSPTNTFIFILNSPTPSKAAAPTGQPNVDYACILVSQTPQDNSVMGAGSAFSARWQVKNTGRVIWDSNNADYRYKSGTKMHRQPAYDLPKSVAPGDMVDLTVDMVAPSSAGKYSTTWAIRTGKTEFCKVSLTIMIN